MQADSRLCSECRASRLLPEYKTSPHAVKCASSGFPGATLKTSSLMLPDKQTCRECHPLPVGHKRRPRKQIKGHHSLRKGVEIPAERMKPQSQSLLQPPVAWMVSSSCAVLRGQRQEDPTSGQSHCISECQQVPPEVRGMPPLACSYNFIALHILNKCFAFFANFKNWELFSTNVYSFRPNSDGTTCWSLVTPASASLQEGMLSAQPPPQTLPSSPAHSRSSSHHTSVPPPTDI